MVERRAVIQSCSAVLTLQIAGCTSVRNGDESSGNGTPLTPTTPNGSEFIDLKFHNSTTSEVDIEFQIEHMKSSNVVYTGGETIGSDELVIYSEVFESGISYRVSVKVTYPDHESRKKHEFAESGDIGTLYVDIQREKIEFSEVTSSR